MSLIISESDIGRMERFHRVNFIHSLAGFKSPFLIASLGDIPNLAVFSSVFHLGSNPPLLGIKFRPITQNKHTYTNLKRQGLVTLNSVHQHIFRQAHLTSARLDPEHSEFDFSKLTMEWKDYSPIPFVAESKIKVLVEYKEEYDIKANNTTIVVVQIKRVEIVNEIEIENGIIPLDQLDLLAVNGLYTYYKPTYIDTLEYVSKPRQ